MSTECYSCRGTGLAPSSDGKTPCGFCENGVLTDEFRKQLDDEWRPIFESIARLQAEQLGRIYDE